MDKQMIFAPLSYEQERIWFLVRLHGPVPAFHERGGVWIHGSLDREMLRTAIQGIVRRHEVLRTTIVEHNGRPRQAIAPSMEVAMRDVDIVTQPSDGVEDLSSLVRDEVGRPFDIVHGPLFRLCLVKIEPTRHLLMLTMHHLISDGDWSVGLFFQELFLRMRVCGPEQTSSLPELPWQYRDYVRWQRERVSGDRASRQLAWWCKQLEDAPDTLVLPSDRPRPPVQTFSGGTLERPGDTDLMHALASFVERESCELFPVLLAAVQAVFHRYTGQRDVLVGTPLPGREHPGVERLIGYFGNPVVLRGRFADQPTFRELVQQLQRMLQAARTHGDTSFKDLVETLSPTRDISRTPLFQVLFTLSQESQTPMADEHITFVPVDLELPFVAYEQIISVRAANGQLSWRVEYNHDLFDEATISRFLDHLHVLLRAGLADPDCSVSMLPLMSDDERHKVLVEWNPGTFRAPRTACLHRLFEFHASRQPDAVAVVCDDQSLTYAELDVKANRVAHHLLAVGVSSNDRVALYLDRSLDMVIGILGILKAGAAYLPIDTACPPERRAFMMADAGANILLTQESLRHVLAERDILELCLDSDQDVLSAYPDTKPHTDVSPDDAAYIIYTSGSTGRPKGVLVGHQNMVRLFDSMRLELPFDERDVWCLFHSYGFDVSVWEMWGALLHGGRLVVVPYLVSRAACEFHELLARERVTFLTQTPSAFQQLIRADHDAPPDRELSLRYIVLAGEALDIRQVRPWFERHGDKVPQIINSYGITETTVHSTIRRVTMADLERPWASMIGRPIADSTIYILDERLQPVPIGIAGEICQGGPGVSKGYLNRPELTAERFVPDPYSKTPGARLYRSGDLARFHGNGDIEYLGRSDHQMKLRGFRIELGEIEAALQAHPEIEAAVVIARDDDPGDKYLAAYVVPKDMPAPTAETLQAWLRQTLPEYMVPEVMVPLASLPMNLNGKLDRRALPKPDKQRPQLGQTYAAPRSELEVQLCSMACAILRIDRVGIHDNFFGLGGHSLRAAEFIARIQERFGVEVSLRSFFKQPTIAGLASHCGGVDASTDVRDTCTVTTSDVQSAPLSFAQERLWFLHQLAPSSSVYNYPAFFRVRGPLDRRALESSLQALIDRHESLRSTFLEVAGQPVQTITSASTVQLELADLTGVALHERDCVVEQRIAKTAQQPFDLTRGPLWRAGLWELAYDDHIFWLVIHHIVTDGWSMGVLYRELATLYRAFTTEESPELPELPVRYVEHARWQRQQWADGQQQGDAVWWQEQLAGVPHVLDLPTDRPRPSTLDFRGSSIPVELDAGCVQKLRALAASVGATPAMALLAAFSALLHRYTGQSEFLMGVPHANRERAGLENVVGMFVNTLPLHCDFGGNPSYRELIMRVRDTSLDAYEHAGLAFEHLVQALAPERDAGRNPLVQVACAPQIAELDRPMLVGLTIDVMPFELAKSTFDLTFYFREMGNKIVGTLEYSSAVFERDTVARMARNLVTLIENALSDPESPVSSLELLSAGERYLLLEEWNATAADYPSQSCIHELFAAQAEQAGDRVAVRDKDRYLTYRELDRRTNQLARRLRAMGVTLESVVGIATGRSIEMVVGALAVLKAGAAYLPLDPSLPDERLEYMLADAHAELVLTRANLAHKHFAHSLPRIAIDADQLDIARESDAPIERHAEPRNAAYVIYTSGSTGKPKGVLIEHRSLVNLCAWHVREFAVTPDDRASLLASPAFDASVWEMWPYLTAGASIDVVDENGRYDAAELAAWLSGRGITICFVPTALAEMLLQRSWPDDLALRCLLTGGDRLRLWPKPEVPFEVINNYGPTEAAVVSTSMSLTRGHAPPRSSTAELPRIGRPIANTRAYILDPYGNPTAIGVPGELYIGGVGLARGYLNQPELTASRFLRDRFSDAADARLYRTGDLARWRADGSIEFIARVDRQVKIRGMRIELAEIETALLEHDGVEEAVVVAHEEATGHGYLAAYVVLNEQSPSSTALRDFARRTLPEYMIPAQFEIMESLPRNASGKIDRRVLPAASKRAALPAPAAAAPAAASESEIASTVAEIWCEVLGCERVGMSDAFFDLGGHSLLLARVRTLIHERLHVRLSMLELFQLPTLQRLVQRVVDELPGHVSKHIDVDVPHIASTADVLMDERDAPASAEQESGIAIIGMAGRFPGAANVSELWQLLFDAREGISRFSATQLQDAGVGEQFERHPGFVPAMGVIEDAASFDAEFFGYSAKDAQLMDPQHRVFLECAWQALEHAGYDPGHHPGAVGVFGGSGIPWYWLERLATMGAPRGSAEEYRIILANSGDFLANRVAYKLGLRGPAVNVQSACSTSLVAVHLACQSLLARECDMALAGGVSISRLEDAGWYVHESGGSLSPDGHCRPFDAHASGTVPSNGVALVVLKTLTKALTDGDTIYAVIRGSAVNNDGSRKIGYTAPSVEGQVDVIKRAHAAAGVTPDTITYVEAHGTGTVLGDPIEIAALTRAFRDGMSRPDMSRAFCAVGSLKSNIGHLDAAAGVAGLIKATLALHHGFIPATLHCQRANPALELDDSPFFVASQARKWPRTNTPRRAGVSAFGLGGTNAHVVLEEAPALTASPCARSWHLLVLSARSRDALDASTEAVASFLDGEQPALADVAYTLQVGRSGFSHRRALVCQNASEAVTALAARDALCMGEDTADQPPSLVFMLPGGGTQTVNMGRELYHDELVYREAFDRCARLFAAEIGLDIRPLLFPDAGEEADAAQRLARTSPMTAAIASTEYALAQLLGSWGIVPDAIIGHSLGECMAACLAGMLSLEDAVRLMALRSGLHEATPDGGALFVPLPEYELSQRLPPDISLAAVNGPEHCVVSGTVEAVEAFAAALAADSVEARRLTMASAPHSTLVEPAMAPITSLVSSMSMSAPRIPLISNVSGTWMSPAQASDPAYWGRQLRHTVRFADGVRTVLERENTVLLEVGPGKVLATLARLQPSAGNSRAVLATMSHVGSSQSDMHNLLYSLGRLWCMGLDIEWAALHQGDDRRRVAVPSRPFVRTRCILEPGTSAHERTEYGRASADKLSSRARPAVEVHDSDAIQAILADIWRDMLGVARVNEQDNFFDLGGNSLLAVQLRGQVHERLGVHMPIHTLIEHPTFGSLLQAVCVARTHASIPADECLVDEHVATVRNQALPSLTARASSSQGCPGRLLSCLQLGRNARTPLFLVAPTAGTAYTYMELVRQLGTDLTVYGFRASGLEPGEPVYSDVATIARRHVQELLCVQPRGPYWIGGFSSGGTVAYEMACQLLDARHEVALVCLIDAFSSQQAVELAVAGAHQWPDLMDEFQHTAPAQWRALRAAFEENPAVRDVTFHTYQALSRFVPRRLQADVLYIRARERGRRLEQHPETWWMDVIDGRFVLETSPGNHFTMLEGQHAVAVARIVRRHLDGQEVPADSYREPISASRRVVDESRTRGITLVYRSGLRIENADLTETLHLLRWHEETEGKGWAMPDIMRALGKND